MKTPEAHFRGCLLGGAVGDALGAPVEFMSLREIRSRFGSAGVTDLAPAYGRIGAITDDTQMTLWTAESLLRGEHRGRERGILHVPSMVHHAYLRWLKTQGMTSRDEGFGLATESEPRGWLIGVKALHACRAPGNTCISALVSPGMGTIEQPKNDSKGCGGVMRVAQIGLYEQNPERAFDLACEIAAITHGHPTGNRHPRRLSRLGRAGSPKKPWQSRSTARLPFRTTSVEPCSSPSITAATATVPARSLATFWAHPWVSTPSPLSGSVNSNCGTRSRPSPLTCTLDTETTTSGAEDTPDSECGPAV